MVATLQWFGTATWRLIVDDYVIWLDAYVDRAPTAAPLPQHGRDITRADAILVGHSHFDHIAEAGLIAQNTGAVVVGSALSCEIVGDEGVPAAQTRICSGGEDFELGPVRLRVLPSLHGFNALQPDSGLQEYPDANGRLRAERTALLREQSPDLLDAAMNHLRSVPPKQQNDGGPLAYLLEWPGTRLFWHDTPGMVTSSWDAVAALQPGIAILAAAAGFSTPNIDGQPHAPGQASFVGHSAGILGAPRVILNHHDDWCPPITFHLPEEWVEAQLPAGITLNRHTVGEVFEL